jgi:hypothetical protein
MPRAADLARARKQRRRAALEAEREREAMGYTLSDTQLMRPTREGAQSVVAVQSRPLGTVNLSEPFMETAALQGRSIQDPTLSASAHLLRSTFRTGGEGWMSQVLREAHMRAVEPAKEMSTRLGRPPIVYPASSTAAFPVREAAEERWSGTLRNTSARWTHPPSHKPKIPPPSWGSTAPTFGGGALGPDPVPRGEQTVAGMPQMSLSTVELSAVADKWDRQQGYEGEGARHNRRARRERRRKQPPTGMAEYVPREERPSMVEVFVDDKLHTGLEQVRFRKRPLSLAELRASAREEKYLIEKHGEAYDRSSPDGSGGGGGGGGGGVSGSAIRRH